MAEKYEYAIESDMLNFRRYGNINPTLLYQREQAMEITGLSHQSLNYHARKGNIKVYKYPSKVGAWYIGADLIDFTSLAPRAKLQSM